MVAESQGLEDMRDGGGAPCQSAAPPPRPTHRGDDAGRLQNTDREAAVALALAEQFQLGGRRWDRDQAGLLPHPQVIPGNRRADPTFAAFNSDKPPGYLAGMSRDRLSDLRGAPGGCSRRLAYLEYVVGNQPSGAALPAHAEAPPHLADLLP
jgi:hypothetical protein